MWKLLWICLSLLSPLPQSYAEDKVVTKKQFIKEFPVDLTKLFCDERAYFRRCFPIAEEKCNKKVKEFIQACVKEIEPKIPEKLSQALEAPEWGEKIGTCAGKKFDEAYVKERLILPNCDPKKSN